VTKTSELTGQTHTAPILLTAAEWQEIQPFLDGGWREKGARKIQEILPFHKAADREFTLVRPQALARRRSAFSQSRLPLNGAVARR
jgi:hypothetical protein